MPGWVYDSPAPLVLSASVPPGATLPSAMEAALPLAAEADVLDQDHQAGGEGIVDMGGVHLAEGAASHRERGLRGRRRDGAGEVRHRRH